MDYRTQRLPIREIVELLDFSPEQTEERVTHIMKHCPEIARAVGKAIQVNKVGKSRYCADLKTMLMIAWMLPVNPSVLSFYNKCGDDLVRQMKGDPTLVAQMMKNRQTLLATGGLHFYADQRSIVAGGCPATAASLDAEESEEVDDDSTGDEVPVEQQNGILAIVAEEYRQDIKSLKETIVRNTMTANQAMLDARAEYSMLIDEARDQISELREALALVKAELSTVTATRTQEVADLQIQLTDARTSQKRARAEEDEMDKADLKRRALELIAEQRAEVQSIIKEYTM